MAKTGKTKKRMVSGNLVLPTKRTAETGSLLKVREFLRAENLMIEDGILRGGKTPEERQKRLEENDLLIMGIDKELEARGSFGKKVKRLVER